MRLNKEILYFVFRDIFIDWFGFIVAHGSSGVSGLSGL